MAKQKVEARKCHNLEGLTRDLRYLLDNGDQAAYEFAELLWELDDLLETPGGSGEDDSVDDTPDGNQDEVASTERPRGVEVPRPARGPVARSATRSPAASILDRALDGLAGEERDAAIAELDLLRMHSVGAPRVAECKPRRNRGTK